MGFITDTIRSFKSYKSSNSQHDDDPFSNPFYERGRLFDFEQQVRLPSFDIDDILQHKTSTEKTNWVFRELDRAIDENKSIEYIYSCKLLEGDRKALGPLHVTGAPKSCSSKYPRKHKLLLPFVDLHEGSKNHPLRETNHHKLQYADSHLVVPLSQKRRGDIPVHRPSVIPHCQSGHHQTANIHQLAKPIHQQTQSNWNSDRARFLPVHYR